MCRRRVSHTSQRRCARSSGRTRTSIPLHSVRIRISPPLYQSFARGRVVIGSQFAVVVNVELDVGSPFVQFKLQPANSNPTSASETASENARISSTLTTAYPRPQLPNLTISTLLKLGQPQEAGITQSRCPTDRPPAFSMPSDLSSGNRCSADECRRPPAPRLPHRAKLWRI